MRSHLLTDWAWRPDAITIRAIHRGTAKLRRLMVERREALVDFNAAARRRLTKREQRSIAADRALIRAYLARQLYPPGAKAAPGRTDLSRPRTGVSHDKDEHDDERRGARVRRGKRRAAKVARRDRPVGAVAARPEGRRVRERKSRTHPQDTGGHRRRSRAVSWATIVIQGMSKTRAYSRHSDTHEALAAVAKLPPELRDCVIASPIMVTSAFSHLELDALLKQFGDPRQGLKKEEKEAVVIDYLSRFDPSRHGPDGKAIEPYEQAQVPTKSKRRSEAPVEATQTSSKRGGNSGKQAGRALKALKAKKPKAHARAERTGTPAHFIREQLKAGKDIDAVVKIAQKKFPRNPIDRAYVRWYQRKMAQ